VKIKLLCAIALVSSVAAANYASAQELDKVRIVYASRSIPFLSCFVAGEKGFYRSHGLDVELIQIAPRLAVTALATNEVDYSMNIGSSLRAAMRGLPVRADCLFPCCHHAKQIADAIGISPFVVVPTETFEIAIGGNVSKSRVKNRRMGIADNVGGYYR